MADADLGMLTIFVVDDYPNVTASLRRSLAKLGHRAVEFSDPLAALSAASSMPPDVLITDGRMPELSGPELAAAMRRLQPRLVTIVISAVAFEFADCERENVVLLPKPWSTERLVAAVAEAQGVIERMSA